MTRLVVPLDVPVRVGRDEARRLAAEELAKAKYGGVPPGLERFLARLVRRLGELFDQVYDVLRPGVQGGGGFSPVAVVAIVVLLLALAVIVWRVGLPRWRHRAEAGRIEVDRTVTPQDYRDRAAAAAARADFRTAVGERFRGLVRELEERTVLDPRPARTATEVAVGAAAVLPAAREPLERAAVIFNDAWYGEVVADETGYTTIVALDDRVIAIAAAADLSSADAGPVAAGPGGRR